MLLRCPSRLARQVAGQVFRVALGEVMPDQRCDLLGKRTSLLGGNLKALLPEVSPLSLPTATDGDDDCLAVCASPTSGGERRRSRSSSRGAIDIREELASRRVEPCWTSRRDSKEEDRP